MYCTLNIDITTIVTCVPPKVEVNSDLASDQYSKKVIDNTGIYQRRVANLDTSAADLCYMAAEKAIDLQNIDKNEIGVLVFVTQYPDHLIPATVHIIQDKLGLNPQCICIQINQGCSGYIYGIEVIGALMEKQVNKFGLLLVGDTTSKVIDENDFTLRLLFGDAGSATLLKKSANAIMVSLGSDGSNWKDIYLPNKAFKYEANTQPFLQMNGINVFMFGISKVTKLMQSFMNELKISSKDVDYLVLHQANKMMNDKIAQKLGFNQVQNLSSLELFGNTSNTSIPLTICNSLNGNLSKDFSLLIAGFGTGLSWGFAHLTLYKEVMIDMINLGE